MAFREVQRFRQPALVAFVAIAAALQWALVTYYLVLGRSFGGESPTVPAVLVPWALLGVGLPVVLWRLELVTEVGPDELRVTFGPTPARAIPGSAIAGFRVVTYRPLREFGGFGARWASGGRRAYTAGGRRGVEVDLVGSEQVVLGSRRPEELEAAIDALVSPRTP